jgi:hypothetical protein
MFKHLSDQDCSKFYDFGDKFYDFGDKEPLKIGLIYYSSSYELGQKRDDSKIKDSYKAIRFALDEKLDVLVLPEYTFFPNEPLSEKEMDKHYKQMSEITVGHDTLVLPGTCVWIEKDPDNPLAKHYLHNTLPIFHNGEYIYTYDKMVSGGEIEIASYFNTRLKPGEKVGVIDYKGLKIGFEICADHDLHMLRKAGVNNLDLQIVTACGMYLLDEASVVRKGGYRILCDGFRPEVKVNHNNQGYEYVEPTYMKKISNNTGLFVYYLTEICPVES